MVRERSSVRVAGKKSSEESDYLRRVRRCEASPLGYVLSYQTCPVGDVVLAPKRCSSVSGANAAKWVNTSFSACGMMKAGTEQAESHSLGMIE